MTGDQRGTIRVGHTCGRRDRHCPVRPRGIARVELALVGAGNGTVDGEGGVALHINSRIGRQRDAAIPRRRGTGRQTQRARIARLAPAVLATNARTLAVAARPGQKLTAIGTDDNVGNATQTGR